MIDPGASGGHAGHPAIRHPVRAAQADRVQPTGRHTAGGRPQPRQAERSAQERQQTLHVNFVSHENRSLYVCRRRTVCITVRLLTSLKGQWHEIFYLGCSKITQFDWGPLMAVSMTQLKASRFFHYVIVRFVNKVE